MTCIPLTYKFVLAQDCPFPSTASRQVGGAATTQSSPSSHGQASLRNHSDKCSFILLKIVKVGTDHKNYNAMLHINHKLPNSLLSIRIEPWDIQR